MPLSNAERQKRFRERRKAERAEATNASGAPGRSLPDIIAGLPDEPKEGLDGDSLRAFARAELARIQKDAIDLVEILLSEDVSEASEIATLLGVEINPAGGISGADLFDHAKRAGFSKRELARLSDLAVNRDPLSLSGAYAFRPTLERLGLWKGSVT
ncbi:hypothetical protein [Inquilinus limosus]|uniref:Uncharacterized protein n=1 Tax=Inquilinus limosus MP06 TaxID=1398085 RepID=A0A0A0DAE8_9PROT|nr:hypothetical protein [Inquilinus limosus]KGM35696.1 hypothetical protein P409_02925 [Inquilinus limosus MP06]